MLEVRDIHTYYGGSYVLQGVSLKAEQGSVVAILGRNGMGKTTLMRSIIGFTPPRRGQLWFKGVEITRLPSYRIARMGMGIIPQGRRISPPSACGRTSRSRRGCTASEMAGAGPWSGCLACSPAPGAPTALWQSPLWR